MREPCEPAEDRRPSTPPGRRVDRLERWPAGLLRDCRRAYAARTACPGAPASREGDPPDPHRRGVQQMLKKIIEFLTLKWLWDRR